MPGVRQRIGATQSEAKPLRHAWELVIVLDPMERIVSWNRKAEEWFRFGSGEAPDARLQKVYQLCWATPDEQRAAFAAVLASGAWRGHNTRVLERESIAIETTVSRLLDANGETVGTVITVREATQPNGPEPPRADWQACVRPASTPAEADTKVIAVCAGCKAMRDPEGCWQPAEAYVGQRFNVAFTHSMCPECIQRFYPDLSHDGPPSS